MTRFHCAIYTRKSSEEGLEQSFNSLDAQREACEAYVLSQKAEGWKALPTLYDDGGFSGGSMERPALQRLLRDIATGRINVVIVYKVDRLTRSLADFARIVDVFDAHGVSFVSVTQAFNTTSSMGRLTLNVLLSFAQFEREVTGERIRDKIAASKAKGMWMGGYPPLGYEAAGRTLKVVQDEAEAVRHIFARYLKLKSVNALAADLEASGIRSKIHRHRNGEVRGGTSFSRGALFHLLRNRIYVGDIVHKRQAYPGQHEAIVDVYIFKRVQDLLSTNAVRTGERRFDTAPLAGRLFDALGRRMTPAHAYGKAGRRYRYYVSAGAVPSSVAPEHVTRVSAAALEELVLDRMRALLGKAAGWPKVLRSLRRIEVREKSLTLVIDSRTPFVSPEDEMRLDTESTADEIRIAVPAALQPRKGSTRIMAPAGTLARAHYDRPLIEALKRAHRGLAARGVHFSNVRPELAQASGLDDPYLRRIAPLAFMAPDIQRAIMNGRQPVGLTLKRLLEIDLPLDWAAQRDLCGMA